MLRSRPSLLLRLVLALIATGACETDPTAPGSPEPVAEHAEPERLTFRVPALTAEVFRPDVVEALPPPATGPALTEIGDDPLDDTSRPLQQIWNAETRVWFDTGYAVAIGKHDYIGNLGRVSTTAHVTFEDAHLGSQSATKQDYMPFFADFGMQKHIWIAPKVYTDHTCGLAVQGDSEHSAWWQMYQGRSAPEWGVAVKSTQSSPLRQSGCAGAQTGQTRLSQLEPSGTTCYYLITYDLDTGEIVRAEFLYCTSTGPKF